MARALLVSLFGLILSAVLGTAALSQDAPQIDRSATGGAKTLEDIMARQRGEVVDQTFRSEAIGDPANATGLTNQLGTRGGVSDSELWRAFRFGSADITTQVRGPAADVLIQDGGMWWLTFREGTLTRIAAYLMGGTLLLLVLFYLIRGRIMIDGEKTGRKITRFKAIERFAHWLLAGSFIALALTGIISLFGRKVMIPLFGHESFALVATGSKWVHNNISWAFIIGLVMVFFLWFLNNLPKRADLKWLAQGGGIFKKGVHPPAGKFNAGQKLIFWSVILIGGAIALTGVSQLFPFEIPLAAQVFSLLNSTGLAGLFGFGELNTALSPQEEMQYTMLWHAILSFILIAIVVAHIYIGSVGMEGAYDAMASGEVEEQWAREHHSIWVEKVSSSERKSATPAE